jgi:hypothetical protein
MRTGGRSTPAGSSRTSSANWRPSLLEWLVRTVRPAVGKRQPGLGRGRLGERPRPPHGGTQVATGCSRENGASVGRVDLEPIRPTEARLCRRYSPRPVPVTPGTAARRPPTSLASPRPRSPRPGPGPVPRPSRTPRCSGPGSSFCCTSSPTCAAHRRHAASARARRGSASGGGTGWSRGSRSRTRPGPDVRRSSPTGCGRW